MKLIIEDYNLQAAEKHIIERALAEAGSIVRAAVMLGISRDSLKRRIVKLNVRWVREMISRREVTLAEQADNSDGKLKSELERFVETAKEHGATRVLVGMNDGTVYDMLAPRKLDAESLLPDPEIRREVRQRLFGNEEL